jgi:serine/threonine protein kinase
MQFTLPSSILAK